MPATTYTVRADWDAEADVWVATSDEVPGLCTEAATLEALATKLRVMIPELLEANHLADRESREDLCFELVGHRLERLRTAS